MDKDAIVNVLKKTDPFELLDNKAIEALSENVEVRIYPANSYVFKQDEPSLNCLFIITAGLVEVVVANGRGAELPIGLKRVHDFFGESVVLSGENYPASARVKERLSCCLIHRADLEKLIYTYPDFCGFFNALLTERMRVMYEEVMSFQAYQAPSPGFSPLESPYFRKRVSEVMSYPPVTCRVHDKVVDAARLMAEKDITAIVALDGRNRPRGILTEKTIVKYLIAQQLHPLSICTVEKIMSANLTEIRPQAFIGQALVSMMRGRNKHLVVMERGELVGIVAMVDLLRTQSAGTLLLTRDIESQPDIKGLILVSQEFIGILGAMLAENAGIQEIFDVMSELGERLTRRVIQLAEERMQLEGWGSPPVDYCWLNLGSAARYEQTFSTDQDNAIIYEDPPPDEKEATDLYFSQLASFIIEGLNQCGFSRCPQKVMGTNPRWRRCLSDWLAFLENWHHGYSPDKTRMIAALFDMRPVWGNNALADQLRQALFAAFHLAITAEKAQADKKLDYQLPISFLGTFVTETSGMHKNEMNLKKSGTIYMVRGVRALAIKYGISEPSTFGRLRRLIEKGGITAAEARIYGASFETILNFKLKENMRKVKQGRQPDSFIDPYSLRKRDRMMLKGALSGIFQLLERVREEFGESWIKDFME